jgi:uncharacterized protein (DUF779 family)
MIGISCAGTTFWVAPDWAGTKSGTQSQPWSALNWTSINLALASGDVTVYFSARKAISDTDAIYNGGIGISSKTPNPVGTLILDGNSYYNSSISSPNWVAYSGKSKCQVRNFDAQDSSHTKYNKVTIRGFRVRQTSSGKCISICGDNWLIEGNDIAHGPGGSSGPCLMLTPTSDGAHEGSSAYCLPSNNIVIKNNEIHDSYGELMYIGGGGVVDTSAGAGYPSHTNVQILNNIIYNCGTYGAQGDCIDLKGGLVNVTIKGNNVTGNAANARMFVSQGQINGGPDQNYIIEDNYFHDSSNSPEDAYLHWSTTWGSSKGTFIIRNNVFDTLNSSYRVIEFDGLQAGGMVQIYNNTFYNTGASINNSGVNGFVVKKNAFLSVSGNLSLSGSYISGNNAYNGICNACGPDSISGLSTADFINAPGKDFHISTTSLLYQSGDITNNIGADGNLYIGISPPTTLKYPFAPTINIIQ